MPVELLREQRIRRTILEELPEALRASQQPFVSSIYIPVLRDLEPSLRFIMLDILAHEGRIKIHGNHDADRAVSLTPLGRRSLEQSEEDWQSSQQGMMNQSIEFNNTQIGNFAQVIGHQATISQTNTNDLASVFGLIDRLLQQAMASINLTPQQKADTEVEIEQLKSELQRSNPRTNWVQKSVNYLQGLNAMVKFGESLPELIHHLQHYLPHLPPI